MKTEELYKETICSNCANENCNRLELVTMKIDKSTVTKCKNFVGKNNRKCIVRNAKNIEICTDRKQNNEI